MFSRIAFALLARSGRRPGHGIAKLTIIELEQTPVSTWPNPRRTAALPIDRSTGDQLPSVVSLSGVRKSYVRGSSSACVLDGIDLTAERGECIFLIGPSGSGKSTLLSIIGCVLTADQGKVRIMGKDVSSLSRDEAAKLRLQHIGFVFQKFHLIRGLSAAENVAVPLRLAGWAADRARERACELLALVDMSEKVDVQPKRLSVGQCQRVALARALAADPDLVLADEPTASLDAKTGSQALGLLRRLTVDTGKTVIVVTHDLRILPFADRVLHLENGRLQEDQKGHGELTCAAIDPRQELLPAT
jgi:putative ABC transport system ATP-binding protein